MSGLTTTTHSRHSSSDGERHQDVAMDDYEYEVGHKAVAVPATEHTSTYSFSIVAYISPSSSWDNVIMCVP